MARWTSARTERGAETRRYLHASHDCVPTVPEPSRSRPDPPHDRADGRVVADGVPLSADASARANAHGGNAAYQHRDHHCPGHRGTARTAGLEPAAWRDTA